MATEHFGFANHRNGDGTEPDDRRRNYVVTCDRRIDRVGKVLAGLNRDQRSRHEIPSYIRFPRTLYLWETSLEELPRVEGQQVG
jgi:hypothetical protein